MTSQGYVLDDDGDFGGKSFAALMALVGGGSVTPLRSNLGKAAAQFFPSAYLTTPLRIAHALAQQSVETNGFSALVENLNYRVSGLLKTFSRKRISASDCERLGRKADEGPLSPQRQMAIANIIYGGTFGVEQLGNTQTGDGWRFRGRGAKQTTGRANYSRVADLTQLPLLDQPELLEIPSNGMKAACIFWTDKRCNSFADADNIAGLTLRINGGDNGLPERKAALAKAKTILL